MSDNNKEMLQKMITLAVNAHDGQFDKSGEPYILHPLTVMRYMGFDADDELRQICVGHDLIEDTKTTFTQLRELGFSKRVVSGISCLTKFPGETIEEYQLRVLSNVDACKAKMGDLYHNSLLLRLKGVTEKDMNRSFYYQRFFVRIKEHLAAEGISFSLAV